MALSGKSLFLYGFEVNENNRSIDFKTSNSGPELQATLTLGFYSLSELLKEVKRAMQNADLSNTYTVTAARNTDGTVKVTISTSGSFLSLLFQSGTRVASSSANLLGYTSTDKTGSTSYQAENSVGYFLISTLVGYNYVPPDFSQRVFGSVNVSASGTKESIVFQIQKFIEIEFRFEPKNKVLNEWSPFFQWAIRQRTFEFTPDISSPNDFYVVTLEKTNADGKGLAFRFQEMLPQFPNFYKTGTITMRLVE